MPATVPATVPGVAPANGPSAGRQPQQPAPTPPASWPPVHRPPLPSSSAASAPALDAALDQTADGDRPATGVTALARRAWASPAAFAIVFVVAFIATFGPGALWKLRSPDLLALIESGQAHAVVALLEEREKNGDLGKDDWVLYGHAMAAAYGTYRRGEMLAKYAVAVQSKRVDATALQNTIEALADQAVQRDAIGVLKLAWPEDLAVEERLQERTGDDNVRLRHGAVEALAARNAPGELVRSVRARAAVVDLRARACPTTEKGLQALRDLVQEKAVAALRERKVADALLDLQSDAALVQVPCVQKTAVRTLHREVAALLDSP